MREATFEKRTRNAVWVIAQFYKWNDGRFTYYVNPNTGERKIYLDEDDEEVAIQMDDFIRDHERRIPWKVRKLKCQKA